MLLISISLEWLQFLLVNKLFLTPCLSGSTPSQAPQKSLLTEDYTDAEPKIRDVGQKYFET